MSVDTTVPEWIRRAGDLDPATASDGIQLLGEPAASRVASAPGPNAVRISPGADATRLAPMLRHEYSPFAKLRLGHSAAMLNDAQKVLKANRRAVEDHRRRMADRNYEAPDGDAEVGAMDDPDAVQVGDNTTTHNHYYPPAPVPTSPAPALVPPAVGPAPATPPGPVQGVAVTPAAVPSLFAKLAPWLVAGATALGGSGLGYALARRPAIAPAAAPVIPNWELKIVE